MSLNCAATPAAAPPPSSSACPPVTCECGCANRAVRYPSDTSDTQWASLQDLLPAPTSGGRPEKHHRRAILDAIFYWVDNGIKWRALPIDFPPWRTVYGYLSRWGDRLHTLHLLDRIREAVRVTEGRAPTPTAGIIDSQSVAETAEALVAPATSGYDGHKKVNGRKRHLLVDTLGLVVYVLVSPANVPDFRAAGHLLAVAENIGMDIVWADNGYQDASLIDWVDRGLGITLQIIKRPNPTTATTGFQVIPRRWVVERTNAWISRHRRCARDYERTVSGHLNAVWWSAILGMTRRLTSSTARWKTRGRLPQPDPTL